MEYDFSGWATKHNIKCSDGRTILKDAFKDDDGRKVPLVWNHQHNDPNEVLGHAILKNMEDGVYAYCKFNNTDSGKQAKALVVNGDVDQLSIFANRLKSQMGNVMHGCIREVSLVLAGANPGAYIDSVIAHSDGAEEEEEGTIYTNEYISVFLEHSDEDDESDEEVENDEGGIEMDENERTVEEIFESLDDEQKEAVYALVGEIVEDIENGEVDEDDEEEIEDDEEENDEEDEEGEDEDMKHNVFDQDEKMNANGYIAHSDQKEIIELAKSAQVGSLQAALEYYADSNSLQHADVETAVVSGFSQTPNDAGYSVSTLFPEYKEVRPGAPELITSDQGWISVVLNKVHKSPISRIRTSQVDIRNIDELRAKGYVKGRKKGIVGNFNLVRRTTDPQTIYVKNQLHRDDIVDITDFDYVNYLYKIDRMNLNEELATAILMGDGRAEGAEGKIEEDKIRPIWLDDNLYTLHVDLDIEGARSELQGTNTGANFGENYIYAEAMINTVLYARENFKGTGTPDYFCTPRMLNTMLLARDLNGRRIYNTKAELASALNVGGIYTVEQMANKTRVVDGATKKLTGLICNLADYSLGSTKGGQITHFNQFDIDFNLQKSLLETRCSGALTRVYSAIAIEEVVTPASNTPSTETEDAQG